MARVLSFLKRYFSNYYTLLRSDLAARAAPLDPRLLLFLYIRNVGKQIQNSKLIESIQICHLKFKHFKINNKDFPEK